FWAALIKATRVWGGAIFSGRAFGLLDGGRGMYAALIGMIGVALFASTVSGEGRIERTDELVEAFRVVILAATVFTIGIGIIVGFGLKSPQGQKGAGIVWSDVKSILRLPTVWLQSIIIICAYVGYKCSDDFSLYANEVMLFDDVDSAKMSTLSYWIRPIGAISAGFLADRFTSVNMIIISFATMFIGASLFASGLVVDST
ncbi:MAG: MFS transporter, partial [Bacteroidota bacterium]